MKFNFDNVFLLIGAAVILIGTLGKKKKVKETLRTVISGDDPEYIDDYSDDYSDNEVDETIPDLGLSGDVIAANLTSPSHSYIAKESEVPFNKETKELGYLELHDTEEKDVEHFDLRNAVIMSTILERKYF